MHNSILDMLLEEVTITSNQRDFRIQGANHESNILRHDVDSSLVAAGKFCETLDRLNIKSNFFVRTDSNLYNLSSPNSINILRRISENHRIGLHIDSPGQVPPANFHNSLHLSLEILNYSIGKQIDMVSWHRPLKSDLAGPELYEGMINLYSSKFFKNYFYLSDSANTWDNEKRSSLIDAVNKGRKFQLLLHPEWWIKENGKESFCKAFLHQLEPQIAEINAENRFFNNCFNLDWITNV